MELMIEGMSCGGCVKSVTRIILKNSELAETDVTVSLEKKSATFVSALDDATILKLKNALDAAGFELKQD